MKDSPPEFEAWTVTVTSPDGRVWEMLLTKDMVKYARINFGSEFATAAFLTALHIDQQEAKHADPTGKTHEPDGRLRREDQAG